PDLKIGLISNAQGDRGDLLRWVLNALEVPLPQERDYVSLFQHFQNFAIDEYAAGRRVVLIIDEAQNLGADMLEELRMLTNVNSGTDEVLQIILTGQPELRELITQPSLRQFAQRVMATFHLNPFSADETEAYIRHRLKIVGGTGQEFDQLAIRAIHNQSNGIPRLINKIAEIALVYAAASDETSVMVSTIAEIKKDGISLESRQTPYVLSSSVDEPPGKVGE
ncbi:MAG: AAA family ATPase, partial [Pseudomonadota bacterium]